MSAPTNLSERERDVLHGIVEDKTYREIAAGMGVSTETVKTYANRLRRKLGINSKTGLALWAASHLDAYGF